MVCFGNLSIAVRMIGFYGLVVGAIVTVQMAAELTERQWAEDNDVSRQLSASSVASAWLLGLSADEFGSRFRHSMHKGRNVPHAPHVHNVHFHNTVDRPPHLHVEYPQPEATEKPLPPRNNSIDKEFIEAENQMLTGFLMCAVAYSSCSALLLAGSICESRWAAVPWLVAHLGSLSAQTAVLVFQITAARSYVRHGHEDHPDHPPGAHIHEADRGNSASPLAIILSAGNLAWLFFMWTVVILAVRLWRKRQLNASPVAAPGDESYVLSGDESFLYLESIK